MKPFASVVVLGAAAALAGCQDAVTSPATKSAADAAVSANLAAVRPEQLAGLTYALGDASTRLAATFKDAMLREQLNEHLSKLSAHLDQGAAVAARQSLASARKVLARLAALGDDGAAAADLDGIGLALDQVELTLNGTIADR